MIDCPPIIGVLVANGSVVEIGYVPVLTDKLPPLQHLLDIVLALMSWAEVETGNVEKSSWVHTDCTPRAASGPKHPDGKFPFRGGTTHE